MLNDTYRNDRYNEGIRRVVSDFQEEHGRAPVVLDIGAGTGVLALMAARAGARHVVACEKLPGMATLAQRTIAENGYAHKITVVAGDSADVTPADVERLTGRPACDLVVHEILGTLLIDEGVIPSLRDVFQRGVATPRPGNHIPGRATVHAQLIHDSGLYHACDWRSQAIVAGGDPFSEPRSRNVDFHFDARLEHSAACSSAFELFTLDFGDLNDLRPSLQFRHLVPVTAGCPAVIHGVLLWWTMSIGSNGEHDYSTRDRAAESQGFQDHWRQVVCLLPEPLKLQPSTRHVVVEGVRTDVDIDLAVRCEEAEGGAGDDTIAQQSGLLERLRAGSPSGGGSAARWADLLDGDRKFAIASEPRHTLFADAIADAISFINLRDGPDARVLDLGDGCIGGFLAATRGAEHTTTLQQQPGFRDRVKTEVEKARLCEKLTVFSGARNGQPWRDEWEDVNCVIGDCWFQQMAKKPLWALINFWVLRSQFQGVITPGATIVPHCGRLMVALARIDDLWRCHQPVREVAGFAHSEFSRLQEPDSWYPVRLWQFKHRLLTQPKTLLQFDLSSPMRGADSSIVTDVQIPIAAADNAHAVVTWVDLQLDAGGDYVAAGFVPQSHEPFHQLQMVRWLPQMPVAVRPGTHTLHARAEFDAPAAQVSTTFHIATGPDTSQAPASP